MTFSYTGSPGDSDIDTIRFYIQDTLAEDAFLTDEEIQFLIDEWMPINDSYLFVASVAAESIASKFAREVSYSADGVTVSGEQLQQKYNDLAQSLRDLYKSASVAGGPSAGGMFLGEEFDDSIKPLSYAMGMNDNRGAGAQEFGGRAPDDAHPEIEGYPW